MDIDRRPSKHSRQNSKSFLFFLSDNKKKNRKKVFKHNMSVFQFFFFYRFFSYRVNFLSENCLFFSFFYSFFFFYKLFFPSQRVHCCLKHGIVSCRRQQLRSLCIYILHASRTVYASFISGFVRRDRLPADSFEPLPRIDSDFRSLCPFPVYTHSCAMFGGQKRVFRFILTLRDSALGRILSLAILAQFKKCLASYRLSPWAGSDSLRI